MSVTAILFLALGVIAFIAGLALLLTGIRGKSGDSPRHTVMLMAGMMATAFGLLMTAFAITSSMSAAPDYGAAR
jgi:hypothetical protein